jgi:hypothetical protein
MAAAAGAGTVSLASRWTAVSVAVAPDEAAMSLELEMQKAYAAFAAAEAGHAAPASTETKSAPAEPASATEISSQAEAATPAPVVPIPAISAPEATQTLSAVASAATDAITAAVQELEAVAASYVAQQAPAPTPAKLEPASAEKAEAASTGVPEGSPTGGSTEASTEESPAAKAEALPDAPKLETAQPDAPEIKSEESKSDIPVPEETSGSISNQTPAEQTSTSQISDVVAESAGQPAASGTRDSGTKESDMAETTAAAWATWRQIRESGAPRDTSIDSSEKKADEMASTPQDAAAMAVAAGAEKTPEQSSPASEPEPENIANIVDSVLADLRPKIFEEITRKMGKNK